MGVDKCKRPGDEILYKIGHFLAQKFMSALSHEYISQRTGLLLSGCINESISTASWSPTPGITLHRCTREGLFVKNRSSILSPRVGVFTSCCTPQSPGMLVYSADILLG